MIQKQQAAHSFFLPYFVDPKDHGIFQVKRQLLGGTEVGETLDAGHHLFYADHLHYVGHHQGIDEVDVGALQGQNVKMTSPVLCHKHKKG